MDDALLVGVLNGRAHMEKQRQPTTSRELMPVAVIGDRYAGHVLHGKVRPAVARHPCVEDLRDVRMVHHRQRLALRFESGHHLTRVHPGLDDLEGNASVGRLLLGQIHHAHSAFAEQAQDAIGTDCLWKGVGEVTPGGRRRFAWTTQRSGTWRLDLIANPGAEPGTVST